MKKLWNTSHLEKNCITLLITQYNDSYQVKLALLRVCDLQSCSSPSSQDLLKPLSIRMLEEAKRRDTRRSLNKKEPMASTILAPIHKITCFCVLKYLLQFPKLWRNIQSGDRRFRVRRYFQKCKVWGWSTVYFRSLKQIDVRSLEHKGVLSAYVPWKVWYRYANSFESSKVATEIWFGETKSWGWNEGNVFHQTIHGEYLSLPWNICDNRTT